VHDLVEAAKVAITTAEEKVKAAEGACLSLTAAAKEAEANASKTGTETKQSLSNQPDFGKALEEAEKKAAVPVAYKQE